MNLDFGKYYEAPEPGRRERAHAWATAIGLQDVDGLKPSQYLIDTAKRHPNARTFPAVAKKKTQKNGIICGMKSKGD